MATTKETIPGYVFRQKVGMGGMSTVFLADDLRHSRLVAVKILHPQKAGDAGTVRRFQREAQLLIQFNHPNIVRGFELGAHSGIPYLAMEYCEGPSIQSKIDQSGRMNETEALDVIVQVAEALAFIQDHGYVHKDVKPNNILIGPNGRVKLCDLGFAQSIGTGSGTESSEKTEGTVQYMSPEQAQGQVDLDIRSDIYSLGATLYHMVVGVTPFQGTDNLEVMARQVLEQLNSSEIKNLRLSRHVHYFIERMMAKEKDLRYGTPRELIEDIKAQLEGFRSLQIGIRPSAPKPPAPSARPVPKPPARFPRRFRT